MSYKNIVKVQNKYFEIYLLLISNIWQMYGKTRQVYEPFYTLYQMAFLRCGIRHLSGSLSIS